MARSLTLTLAILFALLPLAACTSPGGPGGETPGDVVAPPVAKIEPTELEQHGHVRVDNYYWLRERDNPEVIAYLEAENAYTEAAMQSTEVLQENLYQEITGRIAQDDTSVPYRLDDYWYYDRVEEGGEYPIYCRKKGSLDGPEEVLLDVNELAEGHDYFAVRGVQVSPDHQRLAFASDSVGRRIYTLRFKDLISGEMLTDSIPGITGNVVWANDNKTLFYGKQDLQTLRWDRVYRHVLGTDASTDPLIYEELDETFNVFVFKTKSERFIGIASFQTLSNEYRFIEADQPLGEFAVFLPRQRNHEYQVDHFGDHFYIRTNDQAKNFRLMKTPVGDTAQEHWTEVIAHRDDVFLEGIEIFRQHLVVAERQKGLLQIQIRPWDGSPQHYLEFDDPAYVAFPTDNLEIDSQVLRFTYSSMTTPRSTYDYTMDSRQKTLLKQQPVLGEFDSTDYVSERIFATSRDGKEIPISIVYRRGFEKDSDSPLLLYAYGSYGASMDASFQSDRLSLLDRGFAYAIAHIRGGQEMGRDWYEDGKLLRKMNTFNDFIDAGDFLVAEGYTQPAKLFAQGGSAGGLLMGAVTNLRPDLFHGVISHVPFVDVITTMLDAEIPLTSGEWDEWGDPRKKEYYDYMLSYSPYDQLEAKDYPHLLVTTGLHDSQVQYWEPAKYVAKLRTLKTDAHRLLLKTNMEAGHGGASGRFKRHKQTALVYAFMFDLLGIEE